MSMRAWLGHFAIAAAIPFVAQAAVAQQPAERVAQLFGLPQPQPPPRKAAPRPTAAAPSEEVAKINNWTVGLAGGLPEGTFLRFAAEIARNLNDTENLRVLAIVTPGATENIKDLLYLKGIDIAITNADVLEHFKTVDKIPNIERRVNFISEMHLSEVHIVARADINSLADLAGKKVSFGTPGTGQSVTGPIVFQRLGIKIEPVHINNAIALEKMKSGEIAALVNNGGKPQDLFTKFKNDAGFKFLPIPFDKFDEYYVPASLTAEDYPGFIKPGEKVDTIGVPAVLAVYNWPKESDRFRRVQRFIEYYFDRFEGFHKQPYHPKWKTINLAAKVPGWTRYWVAEEKLKQIAAAKPPPPRPATPPSQQAARSAPMEVSEQERLFQQFLDWSKKQGKQ
jgi:TRAP transporter TAXI family solute receptor